MSSRTLVALAVLGVLACAPATFAADSVDYRVLATKKTSTMEKEMNEAEKREGKRIDDYLDEKVVRE